MEEEDDERNCDQTGHDQVNNDNINAETQISLTQHPIESQISTTQLDIMQSQGSLSSLPSSPARSNVSQLSQLSRFPPASPIPSFPVPMGLIPSTPTQWNQQSTQSTSILSQTNSLSQFQGLSSTPLVMGTPRSPAHSHFASPSISNNFQVPRSDMGRSNHRLVIGSTRERDTIMPPTPSTVSTALDPWDNHSEAETEFSDNVANLRDDFRPTPVASTVLSNAYIWGTTVNVQTCSTDFRFFFDEFDEPGGNASGLSYYHRQLHMMHSTGGSILNLNCKHLQQFIGSRNLFKQLERFPQEIIPLMDQVVNEEYANAFTSTDFGSGGPRRIQVRTFGLPISKRMRALDPEHIDTLISVKGMVTRCSPIIPDLKQAFFRCFVCSNTLDVPMTEKGHIDEPHSCPSCQAVASMEMIHNRSLFSDKQCVRIQETPDEIPEGETPYNLTAFAYDDLVDTVRPGDRIEITGIFRAVAKRVNPRMRTLNSVFKTFVDCIHFRRITASESSVTSTDSSTNRSAISTTTTIAAAATTMNASNDISDPTVNHIEENNRPLIDGPPQFPPDRIQQFHRFAESGNVYDRLVRSFAPSIWELTDVKRGALCMLFGGNVSEVRNRIREQGSNRDHRKDENENIDKNIEEEMPEQSATPTTSKTAKVHQRSEINILLCGDPGTSKSQILSYVHKLSPRGIYTSGKGSSAVGLTASVVKDQDSGDMVLESGALVLSDNGICCIDEFDKMSDMTRAILHEAMEQQTVSITKSGIVATLNARTAILASANPVQSRYNPRLSVVENIKLPPTLLSRFDLIYLILDKPNADQDRKLAKHIVSLYYDDETIRDMERATREDQNDTVDQTFMRDYIAYARSTCAPDISDEAGEILIQGYLAMRALGGGGNRGGNGNKTITATTRQLESLIRVSQALAKMRLAKIVTPDDVNEAIRLMRVATQTAATDPRTGTIDMDMISTGKTALNRDLILKLAEELKNLLTTQYMGQKLTYANLRQLIITNATGDTGNRYQPQNLAATNVTISEIEEAVRELENEGVLQIFERSMSVLVR